MLAVETRDSVRGLFAPLFLEVVDALRELVELPDDSDTWSADTQDDFKRFRYSVGDAIFDSCKVPTCTVPAPWPSFCTGTGARSPASRLRHTPPVVRPSPALGALPDARAGRHIGRCDCQAVADAAGEAARLCC